MTVLRGARLWYLDRLMKVLGFFSLLFVLAACTPQGATDSHVNFRFGEGVVGGFEVTKDSPFANSTVMISMDDDEGRSFICTGTFISEKLILTASHCVNPNPSKMSVLFGLNPFSGQDFQSIPIKAVHLFAGVLKDHSDKARSERHDLALIEFMGGLPEGASYLELPRPTSPRVNRFFSLSNARYFPQSDREAGQKVLEPVPTNTRSIVAVGYGRTAGGELSDGNDLGGSGVLRMVELDISSFGKKGRTFVVDQKKDKGVCFGDSGGPAFMVTNLQDGGQELQLIGVASGVFSDTGVDEYALGFDPCAQNSLYTNIIPYLMWIDSIERAPKPHVNFPMLPETAAEAMGKSFPNVDAKIPAAPAKAFEPAAKAPLHVGPHPDVHQSK